MTYLLDTNVLIDFFHGEKKTVVLLDSLEDMHFAISVVTVLEITHGAYKTKTPEKYVREFSQFLSDFSVETYDVDSTLAQYSGRLLADLERRGKKISGFDALIASTVLLKRCTLISEDKIFAFVPSLQLTYP